MGECPALPPLSFEKLVKNPHPKGAALKSAPHRGANKLNDGMQLIPSLQL